MWHEDGDSSSFRSSHGASLSGNGFSREYVYRFTYCCDEQALELTGSQFDVDGSNPSETFTVDLTASLDRRKFGTTPPPTDWFVELMKADLVAALPMWRGPTISSVPITRVVFK